MLAHLPGELAKSDLHCLLHTFRGSEHYFFLNTSCSSKYATTLQKELAVMIIAGRLYKGTRAIRLEESKYSS